MINLPEMPAAIKALPRDERGYPVPWFVAWIDGKPEFRVADGEKWAMAVKQKLCWVCGQDIAGSHVFTIGPMCAVNRTTAEPPTHRECAIFSVKACPFLSMPKAKRREANMPDAACDAAGFAIKRNPGVTCLWYCHGYELFSDGRGGALFRLPNPSKVEWWTEGRNATRDEIMESINSGLPILERMAESESESSVRQLQTCVADAMKFIPKA